MTLALLAYGSATEANRLLLALYSFYAHSTGRARATRALVFTDQQRYLASQVADLPVDFIPLSREWMANVIGPTGYVHRLKIGVMERAFENCSDDVFFVDADTFFAHDPTPLIASVSPDRCAMHMFEYRFETLQNFPTPGTVQALYRFMNGGMIRLGDATIVLTPQLASWNSGVLLLHRAHERFLPDIYRVCDQIYSATHNRSSEQYAFSIVLQRSVEILPASDFINHYWYDVRKRVVDDFLRGRFDTEFEELPLEKKLERVREWTRILPDHIERHPWMLEDFAIQCLRQKRRAAACVWAARSLVRGGARPSYIKQFSQEFRSSLA